MTNIGIYKLEWATGHYYIGQSISLDKRYKKHLDDLRLKNHFNHKVQDAYNKLGTPAFSVLLLCSTDSLDKDESARINLSDPLILNIMAGGGIMYGEYSPRAVYQDQLIDKAFLLLVEGKLTRKEISQTTGIDLSTIYDISSGRGRGLDFLPTKYPEHHAKLMCSKAANTRGKIHIK